jgi:hypothetical protein
MEKIGPYYTNAEFWSIVGQKSAQNAQEYDRIIRVFRIKTYLTILNVLNDRMTHPWYPLHDLTVVW